MFQATNTTLDNPDCVVKVIDTSKLSDRAKYQFVPTELAAMMDVKHRYVIRVLDIFRYKERVYIFMERGANGDLSGYVRKYKMLNEPLAAIWFLQTSLAIHYLHVDLRMAHRDIKLDNILLDGSDNAKICDY